MPCKCGRLTRDEDFWVGARLVLTMDDGKAHFPSECHSPPQYDADPYDPQEE